MFNVGGGEIIVILLIALIVLGPDKLPNTARQVGRFMGEIRRMSNGFQQELRDAMSVNLDGTSTPAASPAPSSDGATPPAMPPTAPDGPAGEPPILPSTGTTAPAPAAGPPAAGSGPVQVDGPSGSFN